MSISTAPPDYGANTKLWNGSGWESAASIAGQQKATLYDSAGNEISFAGTVGATISSNADGTSNTANQDRVVARLEKYNGSTWDRDPTLQEVVLVPQGTVATITAGQSASQVNYGHKGMYLFTNIGAFSGTGTPKLYVGLQFLDPNDGTTWINAYNNFGSEFVVADATVHKIWSFYPSGIAGFNAGQNLVLPRRWRVNWQTTGTTISVNFGIAACLLP